MLFFVYVSYRIELGDISYVIHAAYHCPKVHDKYLKWNLFNFDMLITFCFGVFSNLSQQKSPTAEILCIDFLRTIFRRKYMRKISTVGLFCCDKFKETPNKNVSDPSKLTKPYIKRFFFSILVIFIQRLMLTGANQI